MKGTVRTNMNLRCINPKHLIVQVQEEPKETESGFLLRDEDILPNQLCTALWVGKDVPKVKAGDTVLVSRYGGADLPKEYGKDLVRIESRRVYAIIR